ncbi:PQQ-binding-like beta-propeller repeat protein [Thermogemmatispora carboxidivorans]|uniref:outer membrane protein assembly factor BamB family protein n=1 Tax=Thermogemmatispora carboxidivorans TaxID=1382306 RepID=UPI00069BE669|nr:PQQ-binding-like beta-propeller repeat protein [Thermogemmatispora carboxidivorans]
MQTLSTTLPPQLVLAGSTLYASQGSIYGLDTTTGKVRRQYAVSGTAALAFARGTLYLNVNRHPDSSVQALRAHDGSTLWSYQAAGQLAHAPTLARNGVYVSTVEGVLYALQARIGRLLWRSSLAPDPSSSFGAIVYTSPFIINETLYITYITKESPNCFITAFHTKEGRRLWQTPLPDSSSFPLAAADERIFLSTTRGCLAIDRHNGSVLWRHELGSQGQMWSAPVVMDDRVYVSFSEEAAPSVALSDEMKHEQQAFICALRARDGALLWRQAVGGISAAQWPTVAALIGGVLCVGAKSGPDSILSAYQPADGALLWSSHLSGTWLSSPVGAAGRVYISDNNGVVSAFRLRDGQLLWQTVVATEAQSTAHLSVRSSPIILLPASPPEP